MKVYLALGYFERDMITVVGIFATKQKADSALQNFIATNGPPWECAIKIIELDKEVDETIG